MSRPDHARSIVASATLSHWQVERMVPLHEVLAILHSARVDFVLVGAHSIAGWTRKPRATVDVDVVVSSRSLRKAQRAVHAAFPDLVVRDLEVVTRYLDPATRESVIDLMKPRDALIKAVFDHSVVVEMSGQKVRIPDLEMAAGLKFAAMVGIHRAQPDKMQDAADFARIVAGNPKLDLARLARLGELVYPGGGAEVRRLVDDVRHERPLVF